ncbi:OLC1v1000489C1 [Oldenlandia corymbosa var. corymbosa]|uniref:OLC1v1000489C1 n=1 Tax=Oldenlandia corymbosa var. corymbosa TaxID=529605 RepID=A0AAV1D3T3_OLDCO|nr:OLC1v1000489C1 [Oldenlandia corymbosa var. corymbosa]
MAAQNSSSPPAKKLEGKVAIITGGASGIGEATARLFCNHGAKVVIADIQDEKGQEVCDSIASGSGICSYVHCDVTDEEQVKSTVDHTVQTHGKLDIMFSNAGILTKTDQEAQITDLDLTDVDRLYAVNARGTAACVKHAAKAMVDHRVKGSIVITGSTAGVCGADARIGYHMTEHAIQGLMRCAGKQLGRFGIRVNCVSPSVVVTPLICNISGRSKEELEKFFQKTTDLTDRALGVDHVAEAVLFLASDDSGFITGHNLMVDGGQSS